MNGMTINKPPELAEANAVCAKLGTLNIGESISFNPPLSTPTVNALYLLLGGIDKGWRITPGPEPKRGFWKDLKAFMSAPVTFDGRSIPQTIIEIKRKR